MNKYTVAGLIILYIVTGIMAGFVQASVRMYEAGQ